MKTHLYILGVLLLGACASSDQPDVGLESLRLAKVAPQTILPGTTIVLTGDSFAETNWGTSALRLKGRVDGEQVELVLPAEFVDYSTLHVPVLREKLARFGDFDGQAVVEVTSLVDGRIYATKAIEVSLRFRETLAPTVSGLDRTGLVFANSEVVVEGDGFLLGGNEGQTIARVTGCFQKKGTRDCLEIAPRELAMTPRETFSRSLAHFLFEPALVGIEVGTFKGAIVFVNKIGSTEISTQPVSVEYDLLPPRLEQFDTTAASLGQYVEIRGQGFVGGEDTSLTELRFKGTYSGREAENVPVQMSVHPEFVKGSLVRYVLNVDDALGKAVNLRKDSGVFAGEVHPIIKYRGQSVTGQGIPVQLTIAPIKQVVYLDFRPTYVEGLRDFGLRAIDNLIRERILAVIRRSYVGVNLEVRATPPTDFSLYSHVEIHGSDPSGTALFGYDNSPGKDAGNLRLHDRLGGVNAKTQKDGFNGYGGVFLRSMFAFSFHPGSFVRVTKDIKQIRDPMFDTIFDPFRSDAGGTPVSSSDPIPRHGITEGGNCPGADRASQIQCAAFVLGNLVGGTLAHEIGHSLGLANPFKTNDDFHNYGDEPNRLMDSGGSRPFLERAELKGLGPSIFCDRDFEYLRGILPAEGSDGTVERPLC